MHTQKDVKDEDVAVRMEDRLVRAVRATERSMFRAADYEGEVVSYRVRSPRAPGDDFLLVAKRDNEDGQAEVCFHSAESLVGLLVGFGNRLANGSAVWKPDQYANGREG